MSRRIFDHHRHRRSCPEVERAFRKFSPFQEQIEGQPSLEVLRDVLCEKLTAEGYGGTFDTILHMKSVKGIAIELSVTFVDDNENILGIAKWTAGAGVSTSVRQLN
jgi:hypothetical protein